MRSLLFSIFIVILATSSLIAASFNCDNASTDVEKLICSEPSLSEADSKLSEQYNAALNSASNPNELKSEQQDWISKRNAITDVNMLLVFYNDRINILQAAANQKKETQQQVSQTNTKEVTQQGTVANSQSENIAVNKPSKNSFAGEHAFMLFVVFIVLVGIMYATGIRLHADGSLNIFIDYTDALLTLLGVIVPFIAIVSIKKDSSPLYIIFMILFSTVVIFFPIKSSFVYNKSMKMAFFSLLIKFFTSSMYLVGLLAILFSGGGAKKQNESEAAYQARLRRERASQAFWMAIHHLILVWIISKTTRIAEFSTETLNLSFKNRYSRALSLASGNTHI